MQAIINGTQNNDAFAEAIARIIEDRAFKQNKENSNPILVPNQTEKNYQQGIFKSNHIQQQTLKAKIVELVQESKPPQSKEQECRSPLPVNPSCFVYPMQPKVNRFRAKSSQSVWNSKCNKATEYNQENSLNQSHIINNQSNKEQYQRGVLEPSNQQQFISTHENTSKICLKADTIPQTNTHITPLVCNQRDTTRPPKISSNRQSSKNKEVQSELETSSCHPNKYYARVVNRPGRISQSFHNQTPNPNQISFHNQSQRELRNSGSYRLSKNKHVSDKVTTQQSEKVPIEVTKFTIKKRSLVPPTQIIALNRRSGQKAKRIERSIDKTKKPIDIRKAKQKLKTIIQSPSQIFDFMKRLTKIQHFLEENNVDDQSLLEMIHSQEFLTDFRILAEKHLAEMQELDQIESTILRFLVQRLENHIELNLYEDRYQQEKGKFFEIMSSYLLEWKNFVDLVHQV